jgi:hypothetical protein
MVCIHSCWYLMQGLNFIWSRNFSVAGLGNRLVAISFGFQYSDFIIIIICGRKSFFLTQFMCTSTAIFSTKFLIKTSSCTMTSVHSHMICWSLIRGMIFFGSIWEFLVRSLLYCGARNRLHSPFPASSLDTKSRTSKTMLLQSETYQERYMKHFKTFKTNLGLFWSSLGTHWEQPPMPCMIACMLWNTWVFV